MVLRDKHRCAMASDQPLKKKQRTHPPDSVDSVDCAAPPREVDSFQERLIKQCLCDLGDERPDAAFAFANAPDLPEWPPDAVMLYLSNLQLLFDIYLKQNYKGTICTKLKDARDALVANEHNWLAHVIRLAQHRSRFVNYLACKVVSSFLIVAKDNVDPERLRAIVDYFHPSDSLDRTDVDKMTFGLEVIRRIVEWKDADPHPLEDVGYINTSNPAPADSEASGSDDAAAFARLHRPAPDVPAPDTTPTSLDSLSDLVLRQCRIVTVTDSESFDTSHIKCLTIRCLERHWPTIVDNVKRLISRRSDIGDSETCILSFLSLWENIISVKANLSVVDTKPFYMDFQSFVELLKYTGLPPLIYSRLLSLFNEVLCYGSTLALQDVLPEETCTLAHSIVRFVKDFRLLNVVRMRRGQIGFHFIGYEGTTRTSYELFESLEPRPSLPEVTDHAISNGDVSTSTPLSEPNNRWSTLREDTDKTTLQKMVLLVLKSVAVTVKEMRCDSSDSSIDSTDYNAIQDMQMVERSIRDVLKKLDAFLKTTLDFLPDSPFTKVLIHLFSDQDDYLIESMVCTLDITVGIVYGNAVFPDLVPMLNPIATFVEFLEVVSHDSDVLLDYLVSNETCFLLYLLRFLKYVRRNWSKFVVSCRETGAGARGLDDTMAVLIRLRHQISRLVVSSLFPYNISPVLRLLEVCENLYEGNELS